MNVIDGYLMESDRLAPGDDEANQRNKELDLE